ncbi:MAG TPA: hypothetical protein VFT22_18905 [Kofleriaceae bacterium]|nr:hypothetical protein [Kofleriaceae bacterium]
MAIQLLTLTYRTPRRIRLQFSTTLAAGAFAAGLYTVTNTDSKGASPGVVAALVVPNSPETVELALSLDLVSDAAYSVTGTNVPAVDLSTVTGTQALQTPGVPLSPSAVVNPGDSQALLYGTDIVWDGTDFVEDATGDLARVSGLANARQALLRLPVADALLWDPDYAPRTREFVDATPGSLPELRSLLERAYLRDDRVKLVRVTPTTSIGQAVLQVNATLIGDVLASVQADVPLSPQQSRIV